MQIRYTVQTKTH